MKSFQQFSEDADEQRDKMKARLQAAKDRLRAGLEKNKATNKLNREKNKQKVLDAQQRAAANNYRSE